MLLRFSWSKFAGPFISFLNKVSCSYALLFIFIFNLYFILFYFCFKKPHLIFVCLDVSCLMVCASVNCNQKFVKALYILETPFFLVSMLSLFMLLLSFCKMFPLLLRWSAIVLCHFSMPLCASTYTHTHNIDDIWMFQIPLSYSGNIPPAFENHIQVLTTKSKLLKDLAWMLNHLASHIGSSLIIMQF